MSAKLAYQNVVHLPELPPELWLKIHRFATSVPDPLDRPYPALERVCTRGGWTITAKPSAYSFKRYRASLVNKRHLVRVCHQWYALATPFLYEQVVLSNGRQVPMLLTALKSLRAPRLQAPNDSWCLGRFIKHLDLSMAAVQFGQTETPSLWQIEEIFQYTPNLAVLNIASSVEVEFTALARALPIKLEYINFASGQWSMGIPLIPWLSFLESHPHLRFMSPSPTHLPPSSELPSQSFLNGPFPSIGELALYRRQQITCALHVPAGSFPNLQKISILCSSDNSSVKDFLSLHGKSLTTINITHASKYNASLALEELLEMLGEHCPSLRELMWTGFRGEVNSLEAPANLPPRSCLPNIDTLGLHFACHQFTKATAKLLFKNIDSWTRRTQLPLLRTVRFIAEENVVHLQTKHGKIFGEFLENYRRRGVCVLDHFERPLNEPLLEHGVVE